MLGKIPSGKKSEEKNHNNEWQKTNVEQRRMHKFNSGLVLGFTKLPNPEETWWLGVNLSAWRQTCFPATVTWTETNTNFFQTKFSNFIQIWKFLKKKKKLRIPKKF